MSKFRIKGENRESYIRPFGIIFHLAYFVNVLAIHCFCEGF